MNETWDRILRACKLEPELFEEVEADTTATVPAGIVVVLAALAAGIGNILTSGVFGLIAFSVFGLLSWYAWAFATYLIGTRLLPEYGTQADQGQLLRTMGFAAAPGLIRVLGLIPGIGEIFFPIAAIWMLISTVVAVRQALDYTSTLRAIGVTALGWIAYNVILFLPAYLFRL